MPRRNNSVPEKIPIRAVFFDIGNVLLHFSLREVIMDIAALLRRHPLQVTRYLWHSNVGRQIELGKIDGPALYRLFQKKLGFTGSYSDFKTLWCDHFRVDRGAVALLRASAARVPTYLISNTNALHYNFFEKHYTFPHLVDGAILSHELGLRKPQAGIYRAALRLSRTAPNETVFIDDLLDNIEAARKIGMRAIHYSGADDLRHQFTILGLLRRRY